MCARVSLVNEMISVQDMRARVSLVGLHSNLFVYNIKKLHTLVVMSDEPEGMNSPDRCVCECQLVCTKY